MLLDSVPALSKKYIVGGRGRRRGIWLIVRISLNVRILLKVIIRVDVDWLSICVLIIGVIHHFQMIRLKLLLIQIINTKRLRQLP
jgi:hypothetical protein